MPAIQIRPAEAGDLPALIAMDHNYSSEFVWQMEVDAAEKKLGIYFREVRLPRSVRVEYPRMPSQLAENWQLRSGLLVALLDGEPVGYTSLMLGMAPLAAWMTDLAVSRRVRRQGIGSALVLAAQEWGLDQDCRKLVLEMQTKNYPAIQLAHKLSFDFCGYNDHYYANHDIGIFFAKSLR